MRDRALIFHAEGVFLRPVITACWLRGSYCLYAVALAELRRVLRPGGLLVCSFPIDPRLETVYEDAGVVTLEGRVEHFGQHDHLRVFGTDSASLLAEAGFEVEVVRGEDCTDVIRPVVGPADYDATEIFFCYVK